MTAQAHVPVETPLAERVVDLCTARGRPDLVEIVSSAMTLRESQETTVVVVGETKRGKSSFVNALLGEPVSPVGPTIGAYLVFRYAERPRAWVHGGSGGEAATEIPVGDVCDWATSDGERANRVHAVEVAINNTLLAQGLRLIDTPGVGGLGSAHRDVTLSALSFADALIFVLDPDAPLSHPEYEFLKRATERIGTVFFVLTKIDSYPDWEVVLDEDRRLLSRLEPPYASAPIFAVSSREKLLADETGDAELASESGLGTVREALVRGVIGRARKLRVASLAQTIRAAIDELEEPDRAVLALGDDNAELTRELQAARALERDWQRRAETWPGTFHLEFQREVSNVVNLEFRRRVQEFSRRYEESIVAGSVPLDGLPGELEAELLALATDMQTVIVKGAERLVERLCEEFDLPATDGGLDALRGEGAARADPPERLPVATPGATAQLSHQPGLIGHLMRGVLYGQSMGSILGPVGLMLGPVGLMLGLAAGGATWARSESLRRKVEGEQDARALLRRAIELANVEIEASIRDRLLDVQQIVQSELRTPLDQHRIELREAVTRHERWLAEDLAARRADQEAARRRLAETDPLRATAEALYRRVQQGVPDAV